MRGREVFESGFVSVRGAGCVGLGSGAGTGSATMDAIGAENPSFMTVSSVFVIEGKSVAMWLDSIASILVMGTLGWVEARSSLAARRRRAPAALSRSARRVCRVARSRSIAAFAFSYSYVSNFDKSELQCPVNEMPSSI